MFLKFQLRVLRSVHWEGQAVACVVSHSYVFPPQREGAIHREEMVYELNPLGE